MNFLFSPFECLGQRKEGDKGRPNVILIMTDDQGYGELSIHGNPVLKTPELDKLHDQSIRFMDFHVAPMCTPTRGQLITGVDAVRNGATNVSSGRTLLRKDLKTMADYFVENGYQTGIFGKWHLGDNYPYRPQDRGFQKTLWFPSSHIGSVPDYWGNDYFDDTYIEDGLRKKHAGYCTDVFFNEAKKWMSERIALGQPFFTYLPTNAPHQPFYALEKDILEMEKIVKSSELTKNMDKETQHKLIRYFAMIRNIDKNVGDLISFMKSEHIDKNTILVFLTDNGSTFGPDYYNAGMRGRKTQLYEGGHRVPLFIRWADGNLISPQDVDGLAEVQDILPTLLDLCDIQLKDRTELGGMSLAPVLRGKEKIEKDRMLFINYSRMPFGFDYPSPFSSATIKENESGVLWKRWRLLNDDELYNLEKDPLQKTNVILENPDIVNYMSKGLDKWWTGIKDLANEPQRVVIGSDQENPTLLSACEWMDVFVDQQTQVSKGVLKNSYTLLDVNQPGTYEFELRRWPREISAPIAEGYDGGKSLPISACRMIIETEGKEIRKNSKVSVNDSFIKFTCELNKGPIALHTWFDNEDGESILGAYYVYITRK